uniref:UDP-N-acetylmuramoyl-tripeptide--D-alanyl-D-alanine ligase n=1 Tax=candidate division WOR-3 bacterium TaxID=2052148 RepID=A0A7C3N5U9_UNCW3
MERINFDFILKATKGKAYNIKDFKTFIEEISTDSRKISRNSLFVPIKGEKFDGHDFIKDSFKKGAILSLSERDLDDLPYIKVNDTTKALNLLAKEYLKMFSPLKIGITGSNGKTTTKDLIFSTIKSENKIGTIGNTNNLIGVPINIFRVDRKTEYLILEMGMNSVGELSLLSSTVEPDIVIITTINESHIGNFESFDQIISAKFEILENYKSCYPVLINGDNPYILKNFPDKIKYITFGLKNGNDVFPESFEIEKTFSKIFIDNRDYKINVPGIGGIYSFLIVYTLKKFFEKIIEIDLEKGLENFYPSENRMNILSINSITIIDDSYNANPASMKNGIEVLSKFNSRKIAVLSDMLELGKESENLHKKIGEILNENRIDVLMTVGEYSKFINLTFNGEKYHFEKKCELEEFLKKYIKDNDTILIKGSHLFEMFETVKNLKEFLK